MRKPSERRARVESKAEAEASHLKKHGKHPLLYFSLAAAASFLFLIGWAVSKNDPRLGAVLINLGLALGPVAFLGAIYEWFLFDEIREGARIAFTGEIGSYIEPILDDLENHREQLLESSHVLSQIHKLGITAAYRERRAAFGVLRDQMSHE